MAEKRSLGELLVPLPRPRPDIETMALEMMMRSPNMGYPYQGQMPPGVAEPIPPWYENLKYREHIFPFFEGDAPDYRRLQDENRFPQRYGGERRG